MARWMEPTPQQEAGWREWVDSRPEPVRSIAARFEPWSLYSMAPTGQRVTLASINEDGTVSVNVTGRFNWTLFERNVFGVNPDNLTPCELPNADELTGAMMGPDEVDDNIDALRVIGRPDLWEMGTDGKAIRKQL